MGITTLRMDYESGSEAMLVGPKSVGLHNYATDLSTRIFMLAYQWNNDEVQHLDFTRGARLPPEVKDALLDPHVLKLAFNAQFERYMTRHCLGIKTPVKGWRCTLARAYMQSFTGTLGDVGDQLGLPSYLTKDPDGKRLIRMFCQPQNVTKKQPHRWRDYNTDPEDWEKFCQYNVRDVVAEAAVDAALGNFPVPDREWRLYEIDQIINDRGLPVSMEFVDNAQIMATKRRIELTRQMIDLTGLANPNSGPQLVPWLQDNGYPFDDMQKLTVQKVLAEHKVAVEEQKPTTLTPQAVLTLKLRQQVARASVKKYDAIQRRVCRDSLRLRHCFQYAGAARTNRWSGRGPQPQNLVRTPKNLEEKASLEMVTEIISSGDLATLSIMVDEPMDALAGLMRSSFQAAPEHALVVCDLSAIESAVIAWLSGCTRMLKVFADGRDPYKDFAIELYRVAYDDVTKKQRGDSKPAVLGCGFGLGGGKMLNGKKTGLWNYAEGMGVSLTRKEAAAHVALFRSIYAEIPLFWKECERACKLAVDGGQTVSICEGKLVFRVKGDYLTIQLPSGRFMYYHKPKMMDIENTIDKVMPDGRPYQETYIRRSFTCMGMSQVTKKWGRIISGGPKIVENCVQATAREILAGGMIRAHNMGFHLVGSVHDELIAMQRKGDNQLTHHAMAECMTEREFWMAGLPLKAEGYTDKVYRK